MTTLEDEPVANAELRRLLPASAALIIQGGKSFIALPESEVDEWLADLVDAIGAVLSLADDAPPPAYP